MTAPRTSHKPHSPACDRNQEPILTVLRELYREPLTVLEIGSGTGQHAVYMGRHLPHVAWLTSDRAENHAGIWQWLTETPMLNVEPPLELDVCMEKWPVQDLDAIFSANTAHIMSWPAVECMFIGAGRKLPAGGSLALYGPFNIDGEYTSASNRAFDQQLRARDPEMGIRDTADLNHLARANGLVLESDHPLPANNRILVWRKDPPPVH